MRASGATLLVLGLLLEALILLGLRIHEPGATNVGSEHLADIFVGIMGVAALVYFVAVALVLRRELPRAAVWFVLAIAFVMRLSVLFAPPFLSSDVYRYVWDGRVQVAGINPYRYIPDDAALTPLRDAAIYPNVNRREYAPTIYPPMAQMIFQGVARLSPTVLAMKAAMVAFELVAMAAVLRLLDLARLPRARVLIYAWNPLAVWAFAGNGHVDAAVVGFIGLALLARGLRRDGLAGAALGGAILIKFLPIAIAPALWRRWDWRMPLACAAVIVALYACYLGAGWSVLGYLPGYSGEESISQGGGIWLLAGLARLEPLPPVAPLIYLALAAIGLLLLGARVGLGAGARIDPGEDAVRVAGNVAMLGACTMVAISPHYPWYFAWLALPSCLSPYRSVIFLSAAALLLYRNPLDERFLWPSLLYVPAIILALLDLRLRAPRALVAAAAAQERSL